MTATKAEVCLSDVEAEIVDAMTLADDKGRNWWAVRVGTDGTAYTVEEVSPCYGESEYYGRDPHPVTVWSLQSNSSSSPSDGSREWDDCEADEAEFFAAESPDGTEYKRDWCYPADRDECPHCTVPKKLGGWIDLDLTDVMADVRAKLEACDWLEVTE